MKRTYLLLLIALLAISAAEAQRPESPEADVPLLSLEPAELKVGPGERRLVYVRVKNIPQEGLAAFQVELRYDPRSIEVVDPNAGHGVPAFAPLGGSPLCASIRRTFDCPDPQWMLTSAGRQALGTSTEDPATGRLTIAYGTAGDSAPVADGGVLAVVEVIGRTGTRTSLEIGEAILADANDPPRRYPYSTRPSGRPAKRHKAAR